MTYIPEHDSSDGTAKVIYEGKTTGMKETFTALDWIAHLVTHIPNKGEQMVRYYGYYSYIPSLSSAFDSLCHAFEVYWAKSSGIIQRMYALFAIQILIDVIPKLSGNLKDIKNREKTSLGSFLAGMAFSNTKTTACHSISYPLTLRFGIDHGIAAVMTLPEVLRINEDALVDKDKLLLAIGEKSIEDVALKLAAMIEAAGFSPRLSEHGIKEEDIKGIAEASYSKGRMDNNPVDIPLNELEMMLKRIL
jgi:alcohol dehydrogenase class IV